MKTQDLIHFQRDFFATHKTKSIEFRIEALKKLKNTIIQNEQKLKDALWQDLHKSEYESYLTEIGIVLSEIKLHIKHLKSWAKDKKVSSPLVLFPSKSKIIYEPFGCVLIIAPWNYPFQLLINPLVGAISAGNCSILKPSPYTPNVSALINKMISDVFSSEYIAVVEGERDVNTQLLAEKFDYIFFTGSPQFGKAVMKAAAEHLTPVTLELGGKSPCIVDDDADLKIAARRIVWGKFLNAGQTCIAPDYLFAHKAIKEKLIEYIKFEITRQYGQNPKQSPDFPRIVNVAAFERLQSLMKHGKIVFGGDVDVEQKYIAPTIIDEVQSDFPIMQEEIFGSLLPIMEFENIEEVEKYVNSHPKPLAFYYFSKNIKKAKALLSKTTSGGACINDTIMHIGNHNLPFGGVGNSGMGKYHGKLSFEAFSNHRAVVTTPTWIDLPLKYAPYKGKLNFIKKILG